MASEIWFGERCWELGDSSRGYFSRFERRVEILPLPQQKESWERGVKGGEEQSDALLV